MVAGARYVPNLGDDKPGTCPGITRACYYRWKSKFGGMEVSEAKRLRQLEEENRQLKHIVAEQAVDIRGLKAVVTKKW